MSHAHFRNVTSLGSPNVDRANNVIHNVSVMTVGEARGHGMFCDRETLVGVQREAEKRGANGLAVKFNPQTFNHGDGGYAGYLSAYNIEGDQLFADLHVLKTYANREYLFELAERQPQSFGLSVDFLIATEEKAGKQFARCEGIDAVTVVDVPAANKGLFRIGDKPASQPARKTRANPILYALASRKAPPPSLLFRR